MALRDVKLYELGAFERGYYAARAQANITCSHGLFCGCSLNLRARPARNDITLCSRLAFLYNDISHSRSLILAKERIYTFYFNEITNL